MKKKRVEDMTLEELDETYRREVMSRQIKQAREKEFKAKAWVVIILFCIVMSILTRLFG